MPRGCGATSTPPSGLIMAEAVMMGLAPQAGPRSRPPCRQARLTDAALAGGGSLGDALMHEAEVAAQHGRGGGGPADRSGQLSWRQRRLYRPRPGNRTPPCIRKRPWPNPASSLSRSPAPFRARRTTRRSRSPCRNRSRAPRRPTRPGRRWPTCMSATTTKAAAATWTSSPPCSPACASTART